ncbi:hypothetical protein YC2023_024494 [Brassica napus]
MRLPCSGSQFSRRNKNHLEDTPLSLANMPHNTTSTPTKAYKITLALLPTSASIHTLTTRALNNTPDHNNTPPNNESPIHNTSDHYNNHTNHECPIHNTPENPNPTIFFVHHELPFPQKPQTHAPPITKHISSICISSTK